MTAWHSKIGLLRELIGISELLYPGLRVTLFLMASAESQPVSACPSCNLPASGRFCGNCGTPLAGASCSACDASLTPGAKFCHRCGTPAGATRTRTREPRGLTNALPWAVAGIALVALVAMLAGQRFNARSATTLDAPLNALPQAGLDDRGARGAPDISSMSPRERASRLFDRIMRLSEERERDSTLFAAAGKGDSLQLFAQMGIQAHMLLEPRDADVRYDMGRIAEVAGAPRLARVQADSILSVSPTHLLGLLLAANSSRALGDTAAARSFEQRFLTAAPAEQQRDLPEYQSHRNDIALAIEAARKR
ncbi:MAG: zinc ribbon domain-containing protein [Anaerolineae bacterium]|nr:zinc ribbon domain-containing protein [Gemmatimonadaceae bacterium]